MKFQLMTDSRKWWSADYREVILERRVEAVILRVERFFDGEHWRDAVKDDGLPIETLRRLPGFEEAV